MSYLINQMGSVDDIRATLRLSLESTSLESLEAALQDEKKRQNRATVIKMLETAIRKKQKQAHE